MKNIRKYYKVGRHSVLLATSKFGGYNVVNHLGRVWHYSTRKQAIDAIAMMQAEYNEYQKSLLG